MKQFDGLKSEGQPSDQAEQWTAARQFAALIGDPPRFIRATIHFLRIDLEENKNELSFRARSCLLPLLRSQEFKGMLYFAAKTFFPERLEGASLDHPKKIAKLFTPKEFIALISIMYLYRRMKKGCEKEGFTNFVKNVFEDWLLAGITGRAIERIGFADGLILGILPQLSQCLFLGVDKKNFKKYRTHVRMKNTPFDIEEEEKIWNCNCLQVAVLLAQYLGLGKHYHDPFMIGLPAQSPEDLKENDSLYGARLLEVWVRSLKDTKEAPDMLHRGEFYPFASEMVRLTSAAREIGEYEMSDLFLQKGQKDISETATPELFREGAAPSETTVHALEDLPEEIRNDFPDDIDLDEVLS